ncbi:MAG: PQQ-binding-like beta-propeller repeat protein [Candidatus Sulfotelmatobacter sp.]
MRQSSVVWVVLAGVLALAAAPTPQPDLATIRLPLPAQAVSVALSASANRAAVVCRDGKLRVWDLTEARILRVIVLANGNIDYTAISPPEGRWIFTGDHSGNMVVWDNDTGQAQLQLRSPHYPSTAAFSHDGKWLAIAPMGGPVQVFDVRAGRKLYETNAITGGTAAIAFSRDGSLIVTADADAAVRVYDAHIGKLLAENRDFLLEPLAVDFTSDGKQVIAAGADKVLAFIDANSGKLVRRLEKTVEPVAYLEVPPDGAFVATVFMKADNLVLPAPVAVWETSSGLKKQEWLPPTVALGTSWTRDGHLISADATPDSLRIWRIR